MNQPPNQPIKAQSDPLPTLFGLDGGRSRTIAGSIQIDLDKELQFEKSSLTKPAFAAKVLFITIITVVLYSLFIAIFFFVFTAHVEKIVTVKSVKSAVNSFTSDLATLLPEAEKKRISSLLQKLSIPDLAKDDKKAKEMNAKLQKKTYLILGLTALGCILIVVFTYIGMRSKAHHSKGNAAKAGVDYPSMGNVIFIACMGFIGVIIAEFVFLYTVGYFFEPLDNNKVKRSVIDSLLTYAWCVNGCCGKGTCIMSDDPKKPPMCRMPNGKVFADTEACSNLPSEDST